MSGEPTKNNLARPPTSRAITASGVYLLSNVIGAAAPFLLLPFLTRFLGPAEYGKVAIFLTLMSALQAFVGLNAAAAANREYFDDNESLKNYVGTCLYVVFISAVLVALILHFFSEPLSNAIGLEERWFIWAIVASAAGSINSIRLGQWQVRDKYFQYGAMQIGLSLLTVGLSVGLVFLCDYGSDGRIWAQVLAAIIFSVVSLARLLKDKLVVTFLLNLRSFRHILSFGIPLIPHAFGGFLLIAVDRLVIVGLLGIESAGVYMVAVQIAGLMAIVFDAANKAYVPWLFNMLSSHPSNADKLQLVKKIYFGYFCVLACCLAAFVIGPLAVPFIAGSEFAEAGKVFGWLVLGQGLGGMYLTVTNFVFYERKTGLLSLVTIVSGLTHVVLLYALVPNFGLLGAGVAFAASSFLRFLCTWYLASKVYLMPWLFRIRDSD